MKKKQKREGSGYAETPVESASAAALLLLQQRIPYVAAHPLPSIY
jgi:hypothetical protein